MVVMVIARPTTKTPVAIATWGNPVTDEVNRLSTEAKTTIPASITNIQNQINAILSPQTKSISLNTGWENWGSGYFGAGYWMMGQLVFLRGLIRNVTGADVAATVSICTLPSEAWPLQNQLVSVVITSTTDGHVAKRAVITPAGVLQVYATAADTILNQSGYVALDHVWYTKQATI